MPNEKFVCFDCVSQLPYLDTMGDGTDNELARRYWLICPVEKAMSVIKYQSEGAASQLLHQMKYGGMPLLCEDMGRLMVKSLPADVFQGVDALIPVPITADRRRTRGYNQAEHMCMGISKLTGIPMDCEALVKLHNGVGQTGESWQERMKNIVGTIGLHPNAQHLQGRHLMIVDDIITSGATTMECLKVLTGRADGYMSGTGIRGVRLSVLSLGLTVI